jgi:hypothetical protein
LGFCAEEAVDRSAGEIGLRCRENGKEKKRKRGWGGWVFGPWPVYRIGNSFKFSKPFPKCNLFEFKSNLNYAWLLIAK